MDKQKEVLDRKTKSKELYLLSCGYENCIPTQSCGPIKRDYYILHFVLSGSGNFYINGKLYNINKNQCFFIEPNISTLYQANPDDPWKYCWVCFNGTSVSTFLNQANLSIDSPVITLPDTQKYFKLISQILNYHDLTPANEYFIHSTLYSIFANILNDSPVNYSNLELNDNSYVEKAIEYVKHSQFQNLNVAYISKHLNISQSYLYKLFKDKLNISPQNFILNAKISNACELLIKTDLSIFNVAYNCGYKNAFAFSRAFKDFTNLSPRAYRKLYHKGLHNDYPTDSKVKD